ncbi:MAG: recombinase family protein [Bacteriovoracaceae bacterium]
MVGVDGHYANTHVPHDFIEFSLKTPERISEDYAELYRSGLSLNDISEQTGVARSTLRDAFKRHQIPIRTKRQTIKGEKLGKNFKCAGHPPFGHAYLDGKLIIDPKEQLIIRKILKLRQSGMSLRAIADELNHQKIPTRTGRSWYLSFVKTIIDRNL